MKLIINKKIIVYLLQLNGGKHIVAIFPFNGDKKKYKEIKRILGKLYTLKHKLLPKQGSIALFLNAKTELEVIDFIRFRGSDVKQIPHNKKLR